MRTLFLRSAVPADQATLLPTYNARSRAVRAWRTASWLWFFGLAHLNVSNHSVIFKNVTGIKYFFRYFPNLFAAAKSALPVALTIMLSFLHQYAGAQCNNIEALSCGVPVTFTLSGEGVWNTVLNCCGTNPVSYGQERIYSFTPTVGGIYTFQVTTASGDEVSYFIKPASDGCTSTGWGGFNLGTPVSAPRTMYSGFLQAGVEYYILADAITTDGATQTFQVNCAPDPCSDIEPLTCGTPTSLTLSGYGIWMVMTGQCNLLMLGREKLYSFTPTISGAYTLTVTATSQSTSPWRMYYYKPASTGCNMSNWTCIATITTPSSAPAISLTAGVEYLFLVDQPTDGQLTQTFRLDCPSEAVQSCSTPIAPANGVTLCSPGAVSLSWTTAPAPATSYDVYFGTSPTPQLVGNTASTSYNVGVLAPGTYYWEIRPAGTYGPAPGCSIQSFTIGDIANLPNPCNSITTLTCGTPVTVALSGCGVWNTVLNCCGTNPISYGQERVYSFTPPVGGIYTFQVTAASGDQVSYFIKPATGGCSSTGWGGFNLGTPVSAPRTMYSGFLQAGVEYYILADAITTNGATQTLQVNCVPDPCNNIEPLTCGTPTSLTLSGYGIWMAMTGQCNLLMLGREKLYSFTPTISGAYTLTVTATSQSTSPWRMYYYKPASTGCNMSNWTCIATITTPSSAPAISLTAGVEYLFLVDQPTNGQLTQTFRLDCPSPPPACLTAPIAPANNASVCLPGPSTLSWPVATGANSYEVYFGTSATPPLVTTTMATSHPVGALGAGTYYWQVRPVNANGTATGCPVWSFTVQPSPSGNTFSTPIVIGSLPYTATGNNLAANCWTDNLTGPTNQTSADVYYRFSNTACQSQISISMCGSALNTYVHVLDASGTEIAFNNDNGPLCNGTASSLQLALPPGTYYIVVEGDGAATGSFTLNVTAADITPPTITCPANAIVVANASCSGTVGAFEPVSVSDNCTANPTVTQSPAASTVLSGHNDVETVTLTADDGNGNTQTCSFTVTLKDQTGPTITCPTNTIVAADASCSGTVGAYEPVSVSDNCTENPTVTQSPAASTVLSGHNDVETVTFTADDGNGNMQTCSFTVTLKDQTGPSITCPANAIVVANATCSGTVGAFEPASVSDNCTANPTVTQSPAASTVLSGHNDVETVTLTADDGNGNTQACSFTVTLKDQTGPSITCPTNAIVVANASCSGTVGAYAAVSVSDNCTANPTVTQSPAASTVLSGHNDSETVTLTADDGNGNTQACSFTVTLKDQTGPSITCPTNAIVAANGTCSGTVGAFEPVSVSDNCTPNPTVNQSPAASTVLSGHNDSETVTLTADDGNGNTQACSFTVTLKDQTGPSITCPANAIVAADANCSGIVGTYEPTSVSDNCTPNPTVTQSPASSTVLSGHNDVETVTLTADDGNGNMQTCSFTVTLIDQTGNDCEPVTDSDSDCDGVVDAYDLCPGGDDSVDMNEDGLPDCKYPPTLDEILSTWKCGNNLNKVLVCHNGVQTKCFSYNALANHLAHGDYIGGCDNSICIEERSNAMLTGIEIPSASIYPNPAYKEAWLDLSGYGTSTVFVSILDLRGSLVQEKQIPEGGKQLINLNLSTMQAGIYFVRIQQSGLETKTLKLVVE